MNKDKNHRVKGRLKQSNSKLAWILEITNAINNNSSKEKLFEILKNLLTKELNIGKFALFTYREDWEFSMGENLSEKEKKLNVDSLVDDFQTIEVLSSHRNENLVAFDVIIPVFHKEKPLAYLLLADFDGEKIEISPIIKHLRFIQTLANIISVALENKRLNKEHIKQIAIRKELEMAQKMQALLFPRELPESDEIKIMAFYQPHSEVGGDYYDVIPLSNGKTVICVADVSGKGVSAAILMANFQAHLRALLSISENPEILIKECNQKIIESANYEKFITLFIGIFDPKEKCLTYLNAGHPPAIYAHQNEVQFLERGCTVLGMFDQLPSIQWASVSIHANSKLLCYSDGLSEMESHRKLCFDEKELSSVLQEHKSIEKIYEQFKNKIEKVNQEQGLSDDITFLLIDFQA